ncbi:tRNA (adenine(22)-N(1))-methyltransferase [Robertmurraya andreesenii]|uniref:tRNA (Adenine22-N1)-methyltransferase n=1 Tax=Anoxybacillus andreesenii TaxID=1325932 RepID=A0ABT9V5X6_9BACL|nr:tRNA (adenine(22)-N(1))-methyltransferase TrmK [Robertmurraya andreesenii]MDQ0156355.1 tRNA (adenine22-N1)-methyltransferase [Robertmurraya andreesenii]
MNSEKLSQRLEAVVKYIPTGSRIADIGSDHAYLPCHVVRKGLVPFAIAGEVVEGPFQSARKQVESEGLTEEVSVRKGDGLEVISAGEVDCITIAGMGGALITSILDRGKERLVGVKRLILQPNLSAIMIRQWLLEHGWELIAEDILEEDGKIYEILVAEQGEPLRPYDQKNLPPLLLLGPFLMKEMSQPFKKKWKGELENWKRIVEKLDQAAKSDDNLRKREQLMNNIRMVEEVLYQ